MAERRAQENMQTSMPADYNCPKCFDFGRINGELCECAIKSRIESLFKSAAIPKRFQNKTLENFDKPRQQRAYEIAKDYVFFWSTLKESGKGIFMSGKVGTGKSHLAFAILHELIKAQVGGMAATVPDLMDDLKPKDDNQDNNRMTLLKTIPFLVLDDLGAQRNTAWVTERLFVIINARYSNMLPTVITSNTSLEELERTPGWERIVDRIIETCELVIMQPGSYRQDEAKKRIRGGRT